MPAALHEREEIVQRILSVFREYGWEGASLARISKATGLGRSSLYHHFPNGKRDMGAAALAAAGAWLDAHALARLREPGPPRQRLERFAEALGEFYQQGTQACVTDLFCIGEAGRLFRRPLGQRLKALAAAVAGVAQEAGVPPAEAALRAEDAIVALQGSLVVSRALADRASFQRLIRAFPDRLLKG
jgi:AcrR family transcriptional regulator